MTMEKQIKRLNFDIDTDVLKEMDVHILKNKHKFSTRSEFLRHAILNFLEEEKEPEYSNKHIANEIKHLKSLIELNSQYTYSIMEEKNIRASNLYYGNTLSAIKSREAIDDYYRDKKMNEYKSNRTSEIDKKEDVKEKENHSRWRVTEL